MKLIRCYLLHLKPKYHPQHPTPEHGQPMFLPQCDTLSLTPTQQQAKLTELHTETLLYNLK
jgi:hypothetical protein